MARIKTGLDYFPLDIDFFDDPKILFIADKYGEKGELIALKLLCWIYRNGYYCEWSDDTALIFAKKNFSNIKASLCIDVINELLKRGFFNETIFKRFGILTSKGIQERWQAVMISLKRKSRVNSFHSLLNTEESPVKEEESPPKREEWRQKKGKEKKGDTNVSLYYAHENEFLKDWKKVRENILGKSTNIKKLAFDEVHNFDPLKHEFEIEKFREAMQGLFKQKGIYEANILRPRHFLQDRNIEKYLDAFLNKTQLYQNQKSML